MTEAEICRLALDHIGASSITSLSETSKEANLCRRAYAPCRDQVLRDYPWLFARTHKRLDEITLEDPTMFRFDYAYYYPGDCMLAIEIDRGAIENKPIEFQVVRLNPATGRIIITDQADAVLIYTAKVIETVQFDPLFTMALSYRIAVDLAMPITSKESILSAMTKAYQESLTAAARADALEGHIKAVDHFTSFLDARY